MPVILHEGNCLDVLRTLSSESIDSVVTDPPGGISFMGKTWDSDKGGRDHWITWMTQISVECLRVIKPGGYALVWALPRTSHWTGTAWENAGWEVKDRIAHLFASGFPKSANHLKPACEDWWLLRKPLIGSVAANVLAHGTGAMNIDECRIAINPNVDDPRLGGRGTWNTSNMAKNVYGDYAGEVVGSSVLGRWPANVITDGSDEVLDAFAAFGTKTSGVGTVMRQSSKDGYGNRSSTYGAESRPDGSPMIFYGDTGTAARFFYCAKASKAERNGSKHPTIKPLALMRYLCRLVTPPGGTVLDPFAGSGTTGEAAVDEGFNAVLIEREADYCKNIRHRLLLFMDR